MLNKVMNVIGGVGEATLVRLEVSSTRDVTSIDTLRGVLGSVVNSESITTGFGQSSVVAQMVVSAQHMATLVQAGWKIGGVL